MSDIREEILNKEYRDWVNKMGIGSIYPPLFPPLFPEAYKQAAINAMDENGKRMCLELLEYFAKKVSNFWIDDDGIAMFRLSGDEDLTKEQLFENFL